MFFKRNFNEKMHCSLLFHIELFNPGENMKNAKHESKHVKILDSSSDDNDFDRKTNTDENSKPSREKLSKNENSDDDLDLLLKILNPVEQRNESEQKMQLAELKSDNKKEVPIPQEKKSLNFCDVHVNENIISLGMINRKEPEKEKVTITNANSPFYLVPFVSSQMGISPKNAL